MAVTDVSAISMVAEAVLASPLGPFAQELLVLGVFTLSYLVWRHLGGRGSRQGKRSKGKAVAQDISGDVAATTYTAWHREAAAPVHPKTAAIEQMLMQHLEQREFTRALNLYRGLERDGRDARFSEELYSAFVQSAIRIGKIDVVERMLGSMRKSGVEPSRSFWQTTLKMLCSRKHFSACLSIYASFSNFMPVDKVVLSCLINAALDLGQPERTAAILKAYSAADIDAKDHVLFFRTYHALGDVDAAEAVFRKLGKDTTTLMLNLLLLTCVNCRQVERGLQLVSEAHGLEGQSEEEKIVDVISYNTIIKGLVQGNQTGRCLDVLQQMQERGMEPDSITFGALLELCLTDGQANVADQLVSLLFASSRPVDTFMCTNFIKGLVKANCLERALQLCDEMKRLNGANPDTITYSVLIKALVDQHDLERAFALLKEMVDAGNKPDDIIFTHLLEGCRHAGNHALGQQLFDRMLNSGVKPSEFTLVTMLKLHGRCGYHLEAYDLVAGWEKRFGMKPSVIHLTCLISGCLRTRNYAQAWKAYELMCASGIKPDSTTVSTLLPGLVAAQEWDRVVELAEVAMQLGPNSVPPETLSNALAQMQGAGGQGWLVERLQQLMTAACVPTSKRIAGMNGRSGGVRPVPPRN